MSGTVPVDERRAVFDFEITFSNGGGINGWDFRLDIAGSDISDKELGDHLVRDMRLLMVGSVKILNKRIVKERHKRAVESTAAEEGVDPLTASSETMVTSSGKTSHSAGSGSGACVPGRSLSRE